MNNGWAWKEKGELGRGERWVEEGRDREEKGKEKGKEGREER